MAFLAAVKMQITCHLQLRNVINFKSFFYSADISGLNLTDALTHLPNKIMICFFNLVSRAACYFGVRPVFYCMK